MPAQTQSTPRSRAIASAWIGGLALLCVGMAGFAHAAPPAAIATAVGLSTLFFSPQEREDIVRARQGLAGAELELPQKRLSGVVRREGGKSTVWLNGAAMQEGNSDTPALVGVDAIVKERRLRVGQSVDAFTGETSDLVPPGSVRSSKEAGKRK